VTVGNLKVQPQGYDPVLSFLLFPNLHATLRIPFRTSNLNCKQRLLLEDLQPCGKVASRDVVP